MASHPNRSGAISAELFRALMTRLQSSYGDYDPGLSVDALRHRVLDAALGVAMERAARRYRWASNYDWDIEIDKLGRVHNCNGAHGLSVPERRWVETEVKKISRKALAALEGAK